MGMTEILRGKAEPALARLDDETARLVYQGMIGTMQMDAALRVTGLGERTALSYPEVRRVLYQLAGTALLSSVLAEVLS